MKKKIAIGAGLLVLGFAPVLVLGLFSHASKPSSSGQLASGPGPGRYRGSEPPSGLKAPSFVLTSYRGTRVSMAALRGRVVVATFIDTHCNTKCPIIAAVIGDAIRLLSRHERAETAALALTVEPQRDTRASVRAFLRKNRALGQLDFLLGSVKRMRPLWKAFGVIAATQTGSADIHSADVRVFDARGVWVSTLHVGVDLSARNLAHDIRTALLAHGGGTTMAALRSRFAALSSRHTNKCGLQPESLESIASDGRLQGSCCSAMNLDHYVSQVRALRQFAAVAEVPRDPYDVSVALAKKLTTYSKTVDLTDEGTAVYKRAARLANEHGPCCCHCWRWSAFEGQAKYLIEHRRYRAEQIARLWHLEDGCGGPAGSA